MARTKSGGLTQWFCNLFIKGLLILVIVVGLMYIINIFAPYVTHLIDPSCKRITVPHITLWNWIVIAFFVVVFYKLRESL